MSWARRSPREAQGLSIPVLSWALICVLICSSSPSPSPSPTSTTWTTLYTPVPSISKIEIACSVGTWTRTNSSILESSLAHGVTDRLGGNCRRQILQSSIINQFNRNQSSATSKKKKKRVKTTCTLVKCSVWRHNWTRSNRYHYIFYDFIIHWHAIIIKERHGISLWHRL